MPDTKEQTKAYIAALLEEKAGHPERAGEIDAELQRVGYRAAKPSARAEKR